MNPEARVELNRIVACDPSELTEQDVAFLRARRTYLTPSQKRDFADLLRDEKPKAEKAKEETKSDEK